MALDTYYETKPLECWARMKDLRRQRFWDMWKAKEVGKPLFFGANAILQSLPAGLGDYQSLGSGPHFTRVMDNRDLAIKVHETAEAAEFGANICSTLRVALGSMLLNFLVRSPDGKQHRPDFCFEVSFCEALAKTARAVAQHYDIPIFVVDFPHVPEDHGRLTAQNYLVSQMHQAIEWMEKVTGRQYDDEKLIEAVSNEWSSMVLWAKICDLNKATPAPMDLKMLGSFITILATSKHKRTTVEVLRTLYEELRDRVKNKVAALPTERCRLLHEGIAPWYHPAFLSFPKRYGAIFIGSTLAFGANGAFRIAEDGSWEIGREPRERGIALKNREDALRALAELYLVYNPEQSSYISSAKVKAGVKLAEGWHADGVIFHLDMGCKGQASGRTEINLALQRKGIPTMVYESSNSDPRAFAESQVIDRMESFLESLGLNKLSD